MGYIEAFNSGLRPDPILTVSQWADRYRVLNSEASAEPGPWRTDRTPYLREILDLLSPTNAMREVVFMKGSQVGGTEAGLNWLGFVIHHAPGPTMMVQPTVDLAKRASKQRLDPMITACPVLSEKVSDPRARDSGNTMLAKEFAGGVLVLTGANSAAGLRSMPVKNLMLDEIDAYPRDVDGEGSAIALATARTRTFARRKIFKISTPTYKGASAIEAAYESSDRRRFYVPCPHCQFSQVLKWANLRWDKLPNGKPDHAKVRYVCEKCGEGIKEHHKTQMLAKGVWVAENPGARVAGFHLSALYSPLGWYSWAALVDDWYEAQKDPNLLKVFINTALGETFEIRGEDTPEWQNLYARRESYPIGTVPPRAVLLTAAVDVQKDRLEATVVGWNRREAWVIDHHIILGDTSTDVPWRDLDKLVGKSWPHASGTALTISLLAIDTGFNTTRVYDWVRSQSSRQVMAVKGRDDLTQPIGSPKLLEVKQSGKRVKRGVRLWTVGTNVLKSDVYGRLKLPRPTDEEIARSGFPPTYIHTPMLGEEYYRQLTAEQFVLSNAKSGHARYHWVKTYPNNEALDCLCYNLAAYYAVGANRWQDAQWENLESQIGAQSNARTVAEVEASEPIEAKAKPSAQPAPQPRPARERRQRQSSFW